MTPLHQVKPQRITGPWAQHNAKNLPQPAGSGWGDVDRAAGGVYQGGMLAHVVVTAAPTNHLHKQAPEQLELALPVEHLPPSVVSPVEGETRQQYKAHQEEKREHQKEVKLKREAAAIQDLHSNLRIYRVDSFVKDEQHLHNWSLIDLLDNN